MCVVSDDESPHFQITNQPPIKPTTQLESRAAVRARDWYRYHVSLIFKGIFKAAASTYEIEKEKQFAFFCPASSYSLVLQFLAS